LTDDTILFLKNKDQVSVALNLIQVFSFASGFLIFTNVKFYLWNIPLTDVKVCEIPVKSEVKATLCNSFSLFLAKNT